MSDQFYTQYDSGAWFIRADVYLVKDGKIYPLRVGTVLKVNNDDLTDWLPATIDCNIAGQKMNREQVKFMRDTLDELERIADMLDANPAIIEEMNNGQSAKSSI